MGDNAETAVLAGGCAWIMQQLLRHPDGVISTRTGFMGGENDNPTEENNIGHAEVVEVVFDPARLSYRGLLEVFFQVHRADLDEGIVGSQYRSEIFCTSPEQRRVAEEMIRDVDASGHWPGKTVTNISEAVVFWEMGPEDQDYFLRFPHGCKPPFPRQGGTPRESSIVRPALTTDPLARGVRSEPARAHLADGDPCRSRAALGEPEEGAEVAGRDEAHHEQPGHRRLEAIGQPREAVSDGHPVQDPTQVGDPGQVGLVAGREQDQVDGPALPVGERQRHVVDADQSRR